MSKGADYELGVADLVERKLKKGDFGIDPDLARVVRKPKYHSRDREAEVTFDVSIEVYRKKASDPWLVWIWECKNYGHQVPVDDLEEFHAKLAQVGADRTKGCVITPVGFDRGSVAFAKAKGIGLWRWIRPGSPVCLMEDVAHPSGEEILQALTTPETDGFRFYGDFYAMSSDGRLTTNMEQFLEREIGGG